MKPGTGPGGRRRWQFTIRSLAGLVMLAALICSVGRTEDLWRLGSVLAAVAISIAVLIAGFSLFVALPVALLDWLTRRAYDGLHRLRREDPPGPGDGR